MILDNVLDDDHRLATVDYFMQNEEVRQIKWHIITKNDLENDNSPIALLLEQASKYFDLSDMVGVEYWANYNSQSDWHIDKDEKLYKQTGQLKHPICSIVYYANINDIVGGNLITATESISPITNRMVIFSSNVLHRVEPYTGARLSVAVNPWSNKPTEYL